MAFLADESEEERLRTSGGQAAPGAVSSAQGGAPASGAPQKYTQSNYTSGRMILDKNKNVAQPNLIGGFQEQAKERSKAIGEEADKYGQGLATERQKYQIGAPYIDKAIGGDTSQFSRIQQALRGPGDLATLNTQANLDIRDINKLNTQAGVSGELQQQAQKRGNFGYGQGQAALDAVLFGRGGRANQVNQALTEKANIEKQAADVNAAAEQQRLAARQGIDTDLSNLRNTLGSKLAGVNAAALSDRRRLGAEQRSDKALKKITSERRDEAIQLAKEQAQQIAGKDTAYAEFLKKKFTDAIMGADNLLDVKQDIQGNYYNKDQAGQFNRINELLGKSDRADARDFTTDYSFGKGFDRFLKGQLKNAKEEFTKSQKKDGSGTFSGGGGSPAPLPDGPTPSKLPGYNKVKPKNISSDKRETQARKKLGF